MPAGAGAHEAAEAARDLLLAGAKHPGDAEHLALVQGEVDFAEQPLGAELARLQHDCLPGRSLQRLLVVFRLQAAPDHRLVQVGNLDLARRVLADHPAVLHHHDAVAQPQHLVQPVRHEHEACTRPQRADAGEQQLHLGLVQHRGRLVQQDQQLPVRGVLQSQRLGQLDHLALREAQLGGARGNVDLDADLGQLRPRRLLHASRQDGAEPHEAAFLADEDVLGDAHVEQQRLLLEHHADAVRRRVLAARQPQRLAVQRQRAGARPHRARQDPHQRRLAGAVLADQPEHLALPHIERDVVQHLQRAIGFRHMARCQQAHFTIRNILRSSVSATAAMIISPCTVSCT